MARRADHRNSERPVLVGKTTGAAKTRRAHQDYLTPGERLRRIAAILVKAMYLSEDLNAKRGHGARDGQAPCSVSYPSELPESGAFEESPQASNDVHGARTRSRSRRSAP